MFTYTSNDQLISELKKLMKEDSQAKESQSLRMR